MIKYSSGEAIEIGDSVLLVSPEVREISLVQLCEKYTITVPEGCAGVVEEFLPDIYVSNNVDLSEVVVKFTLSRVHHVTLAVYPDALAFNERSTA